jgi:transcription initiation factor TFIIIB Brf1 subunit/transcription initiation factor TFIIB
MCDCGPCPDEEFLVTDRRSGDIVCTRCGVVIEGHIVDTFVDWHSLERTAPEDPFLPGETSAVFLHGPGGKPLRLKHAKPADGAMALHEASRLLINKARDMGFYGTSQTVMQAKELLRDAHAAKPMRGDTARDAYIAASLYLGSKLCGFPRELRHVSTACQVPSASLNDAVATFKDVLSDKPYHAGLFEGLQTGRLLEMYLRDLDVPHLTLRRIRRTALALDASLEGVLDCSRAPRTICCGLLWMAVSREGLAIPKKKIMQACDGVCQQSLDKMVAELEALLPSPPPAGGDRPDKRRRRE